LDLNDVHAAGMNQSLEESEDTQAVDMSQSVPELKVTQAVESESTLAPCVTTLSQSSLTPDDKSDPGASHVEAIHRGLGAEDTVTFPVKTLTVGFDVKNAEDNMDAADSIMFSDDEFDKSHDADRTNDHIKARIAQIISDDIAEEDS